MITFLQKVFAWLILQLQSSLSAPAVCTAMAPPLPKAPLGHLVSATTPSSSSSSPPIALEAYLDLVCPFSKRLYTRLTQDVLPALSGKISLTLHQTPQPWHFQSAILHEALAAVGLVKPAALPQAWDVLFAHQTDFMDTEVQDITRKQMVDKIANLLVGNGVIDDKAAYLQTLALDTSNENRNGGTAATQPLKFAVKQHRQLGIHVTPTCRLNGLVVDTSSGWTLDQWKEFLAPLL